MGGSLPLFTVRGISVTSDQGQLMNDNRIALAGADLTSANPQRIRVVRTRLSVRSREADRRGQADPNGLGELYRIALNPGVPAADQRWARVRTLQADISLPNQLGVTW